MQEGKLGYEWSTMSGDDVEKGLAVFKVAGHITAAAFLSQLTNVRKKTNNI